MLEKDLFDFLSPVNRFDVLPPLLCFFFRVWHGVATLSVLIQAMLNFSLAPPKSRRTFIPFILLFS